MNQFEKDECLKVVDEYVRSTPNRQYRKDPSTYLNQESWNDEIIFPEDVNTQTPLNNQTAETVPENLKGLF